MPQQPDQSQQRPQGRRRGDATGRRVGQRGRVRARVLGDGGAGEPRELEIAHRLVGFDRASELTGPIGTTLGAVVFVLVVRDEVDTGRLAVWAVASAVAFVLMTAGALTGRRTLFGLPGHVVTGLTWGLALLLGVEGGSIDGRFLWTCLAFQFATTAGVMAGHTLDSVLGRSVVTGLWGSAAVVLLVVGEPILAVAAVAFLGLVLRDLALSSSLVQELLSLRQQAQDRAERAATAALRDPLTGLLNRPGLEAALRDRSDAGAAMFIDLDHFKDVNDRHGHHVGDDVLVAVAERLQTLFRADDLVARLGGDEFIAVLAGDHDTELLADRAAEVIARLEAPVDVGGESILCSASVGVAEVASGAIDIDQVLRDSDHAMYRAKRSGRRRAVLFGDDLRDEMVERAELSAALRRAVRDGRIDVWGQPVVQVSTGAVTGVELLARWQASDGEWIPAARFIPVAEEIGLSREIARTMLARAESLLGIWRDHEVLAAAMMAINVSVVDLGDPAFVEEVRRSVTRSGVNPSRMIVEITESSALAPDTVARRGLDALAALGVTIALDDFGTGYSSISGLLTLPLTAVKIDRSLTVARDDDPRRADVVRSIAELARTLGQNPVAEGIETDAQLATVASLGIDYVQGFLVCPPLPLDELAGPTGRAHLDRFRGSLALGAVANSTVDPAAH